jgi:DNA-binding NtrC family response regulator
VIDPVHLPKYILHHPAQISEEAMPVQHFSLNLKNSNVNTVREMERELIITTLQKVNGNKSLAARILGISRSNLYEKIAKYKIELVNDFI